MFLDKIGLENMIETFTNPETSPKTNQILLWTLLVQFDKSPKSKLTKALLDNSALYHAVLSILDLNSAVVKGRIYLFVYFLIYHNLRKSLSLLDSKIFHLVERQGKDGAKYETQCLQFVLVVLYEGFETLVKLVEEDIKKSLKSTAAFDSTRKNFFIGIISHMINSPIF